MNTIRPAYILITSLFSFFNNSRAQEIPNGTFYGHWAKKQISAYVFNDTIYLEKRNRNKDTISYETTVKNPDPFLIDGIAYKITFETSKTSDLLILRSSKDTLEIVRTSQMTADGKMIWKLDPYTTYGYNGKPARFKVYYYNPGKEKSYPYYPDSMTSFNNSSVDTFAYIKHGIERVYAPYGYNLVIAKRKWKKGVLKKTKFAIY